MWTHAREQQKELWDAQFCLDAVAWGGCPQNTSFIFIHSTSRENGACALLIATDLQRGTGKAWESETGAALRPRGIQTMGKKVARDMETFKGVQLLF